MPHSIFMQKEIIPDDAALQQALGTTHALWEEIRNATGETGKVEKEAWHFSGAKHGWSYRMSDKKRVIIYLLPRDGYFKVAFVFGEKAVEAIQETSIDPLIVEVLLSAKKYAEGRGIRIDVKDKGVVEDVLKLVEMKVRF